MLKEAEIYTGTQRLRKSLSSNFKEIDTRSKRQDYEIICKNTFLPDSSSSHYLTLIFTTDIYNKIVEILSKNPLTNKIFIIRENNTFCIWTSLLRYDKEARRMLYNKELEIIKYFSSVEFHFDFHLADPEDINELLTSGAKIIYSNT